MSIRDLDSIFRPASIALVGASNTPGSVGAVLARNLMGAGFDGPIMPVNPRHKSIGGALAWPDVDSLPVTPELGVVCTPADAVPGVIADLRAKGTRAAIIITAGFGEGADRIGAHRQAALHDAARGMRLVGPNVLGVLVPGSGMNASFAHIDAPAGDLAFVSQSGAVVTSVLDWAAARGIGFSHMVSLGDMADVDFGDMLDYLAMQPNVRAILLYIEAVTNARKFMSAARIASRAKPVVVIKAGRVPEGARAASSHTGALAGSDAVYDAAFRRAGMLRVHDTQELFGAVQTLAHAPQFRGDRLAILSNGGGVGVLATDRAVAEGCRIATLSAETMAALDAALPETWSRGNPVDMIGDAPGGRYAAALEALLADDGVDGVLVLNCPTAVSDSAEAAQAVIDCRTSRRFPVLTNWLGGASPAAARKLFAANGIPTYETPEAAVQAFAHLVRFQSRQRQLFHVPPKTEGSQAINRAVAAEALAAARRDGRVWLSDVEVTAVLKAYGIPIVESVFAATPEDAAAAAETLPKPYALKIQSPDITHKTDVGGVTLDLISAEAVAVAAETMLARVAVAAPDARLDGFVVQSMIRRRGAFELIVGLSEDAQFGPVVLFGEGGTAVEVLGDTAMALPPLNAALAQELVEQPRIHRLLRGYRGQPAADIDGIVDTLVRVAQLAADFSTLKELDINPLLADADGVIALDARIRIDADGAAAVEDEAARLAIKPYPNALAGTLDLRDGRQIPVRPILPTDGPRLQETISRMNPEDIRLRFLHVMKNLPDTLAARLSQIDYAREMAFVATEQPDGDIIGVSRLAADANNERGEFAVMVRSDWKGKGLGYALMARLISYARDRGLKELFGDVLTENQPMLRMCRELGFEVKPAPDDPELRMTTLKL